MAKTTKKAQAETDSTIELQRLEEARITITIKGLTPIISHKWSEKAKMMMPGHPDKDKLKGLKEARRPEEEAEASLHRLSTNRVGMPATAFKAAIVGACRFFTKPSMVDCKMLVFVEGEGPDQLVPVDCDLVLREDITRIGSGSKKTANLSYRYALTNWSARLTIRFVPSSINASSIINLVDAAGRGGVGDWRPSSPQSYTGTFGTWRVDDDEEVQ